MKTKATIYRMVTPDHLCPWGVKARDLLKRNGYDALREHLGKGLDPKNGKTYQPGYRSFRGDLSHSSGNVLGYAKIIFNRSVSFRLWKI